MLFGAFAAAQDVPGLKGPLCAEWDGYSLHAAVVMASCAGTVAVERSDPWRSSQAGV